MLALIGKEIETLRHYPRNPSYVQPHRLRHAIRHSLSSQLG